MKVRIHSSSYSSPIEFDSVDEVRWSQDNAITHVQEGRHVLFVPTGTLLEVESDTAASEAQDTASGPSLARPEPLLFTRDIDGNYHPYNHMPGIEWHHHGQA